MAYKNVKKIIEISLADDILKILKIIIVMSKKSAIDLTLLNLHLQNITRPRYPNQKKGTL